MRIQAKYHFIVIVKPNQHHHLFKSCFLAQSLFYFYPKHIFFHSKNIWSVVIFNSRQSTTANRRSCWLMRIISLVSIPPIFDCNQARFSFRYFVLMFDSEYFFVVFVFVFGFVSLPAKFDLELNRKIIFLVGC